MTGTISSAATTMTVATPPRTRDKSAWPALQPLPEGLPHAAKAIPAKFPVAARFTAGSYAHDPHAYTGRVVSSDDTTNGIVSPESKLIGRDAGGAIAAAAAAAAQLHEVPGGSVISGPAKPSQTLMGVYHARSGAFQMTPLWTSPGTNDISYYYPIKADRTSTPEARFRFTDDKLVAVVATDGWIMNPAAASLFASVTGK